MKLKKMNRRFLTAVLALTMLFSSIAVSAAERPSPNDGDPTWGDVFAVMDYVGEMAYDRLAARELEYADDVEMERHYFAPGTLLISAAKEQEYAAFIEDDGVYAGDVWENDANEALPDDQKGDYGSFYEAGMAFVDSVTEADGKYYTEDIIGDYDSFWTEKAEPVWAKEENGQIIIVTDGDETPDVTVMDRGTYWVLQSDWDAFNSAIQSATDVSDTWGGKWEANNGMSAVERAEVLECIATVTDAYNTLLDKLHEGSRQTASSSGTSLTRASSGRGRQSGEGSGRVEEESAPVTVNEVTFSTGAKAQSSLKGVYASNFTAGCIYQGEPAQISQAAGLSEAEIRSGATVKYYICESRNKTLNEALSQAASGQGYKVLGVMNNDLYRLDHGSVSKIRTTAGAIKVVLGIPEKMRDEQYEFVIMCYDENGSLVIMQDMDTDKATITVEAVNFGCWAVGYHTKK